jgi:hypothetical protein
VSCKSPYAMPSIAMTLTCAALRPTAPAARLKATCASPDSHARSRLITSYQASRVDDVREEIPERRAAMEAWARFIEDCCESKRPDVARSGPISTNVVPFKRREAA